MNPVRSAFSDRITRLRATALPLAVLLLAGCGSEPDVRDLEQFVAATKAASPGKPLDPLPIVEPYHPFTYTAQGLKDPFAVSGFLQRAAAELASMIDNGIHPDPNRPREELEKFALGSLKMVGTFDKEGRWALIKAPDGIVHRIQEGNHMGTDHGKIINITEQRIDLTEIVSEGDKGWVERDAFLSLAE